MTQSLVLGIDLGTSGVKVIALADNGKVISEQKKEYKKGFIYINEWKRNCELLIKEIPKEHKKNLRAIAVDGTSGTLIACRPNGEPLGNAIPYNDECLEQKYALKALFPNCLDPSISTSSIARALKLIKKFDENILLRHQADWINGWLLNDWSWGEEANNLKLGWDIKERKWPSCFEYLSWKKCLPGIVKSGEILGTISQELASSLDLPKDLLIIAGTTDSNAAVLAAKPKFKDGVTVLGSTLVLKRFVNEPLFASGITNHRVGNKWLCGGSSNTGGLVLKQLFNDAQLVELSRQINPNSDSGLSFRPLPSQGDRFPENDPYIAPILEPRPTSDSLYLHGLFEGIAKIEAQGWKKLIEIGAPPPERIITIGGGARNPQWRRIRERIIGLPIRTCSSPPALGVALLALKALNK